MTGRVFHTHGISSAGDSIAGMESVLAICPTASAKLANRFAHDPRWTCIRTGATYRFSMGHALPLRQRRFLCPRNSRGESAIWPAKWPRRCPQPRAVCKREQSAHRPADTLCPRACPVHGHGQPATAAMPKVVPRSIQAREQSASMNCQRQWTKTVRRQSAVALKPCA